VCRLLLGFYLTLWGLIKKYPKIKRKGGPKKTKKQKKTLSLFDIPNSFANSLCTRVFLFFFFLFKISDVAAKSGGDQISHKRV
jgi:hypothetical protein